MNYSDLALAAAHCINGQPTRPMVRAPHFFELIRVQYPAPAIDTGSLDRAPAPPNEIEEWNQQVDSFNYKRKIDKSVSRMNAAILEAEQLIKKSSD